MKITLSLIVACWCTASIAQYNYTNLNLGKPEDAGKFTYGNLRLVPVYATPAFESAHARVGRYLTLKRALETKQVTITEKSEGGGQAEVNKLYIRNNLPDTILIIGGETVTGGKQNRMIAHDVLIPPKSGSIDLSVFCVEQGRWSARTAKGGSRDFAVPAAAMQSVNIKTRKAAAVKKDQQQVWKEVEDVTYKFDAISPTGDYEAIAEKMEVTDTLKAIKRFFKSVLAADPRIIGFAAATGDSVLGCDLFASHRLLMQHAGNLIGSYATEAMASGKPVTISHARVKAFMDRILADESSQPELIEKSGTMLKENDVKLHIAVY